MEERKDDFSSFPRICSKTFVCRFEKVVSSLYMGELVRVVLERTAKEGLLFEV